MTTLTLQRTDTTLDLRIISASENNLRIDISVPDFRCAGMAQFEINRDGDLVCTLVMVDLAHRKKHIASALFDYAEQHFERTVVCGAALTPDLAAFYQARGIAIAVHADIKSFGELFAA